MPTNLPSEYARRREQRRHAAQWRGAVYATGFGMASVLKSGHGVAIAIAALAVVETAILIGARLWITTHVDLSQEPDREAIFPAQIPVFVARARGQTVKASLPDTTVIAGALHISASSLTWKPSRWSAKGAVGEIRWSDRDLGAVTVYALRNVIIPMCLVHVEHDDQSADIWVRRPASSVAGRLRAFALVTTA